MYIVRHDALGRGSIAGRDRAPSSASNRSDDSAECCNIDAAGDIFISVESIL